MKKLLLLLLVCISISVYAQNIANPGEPYDYYCFLHLYGNEPELKVEIKTPDSVKTLTILNEENKQILFNNETSLILFMSKRGWQYIRTEKRDVFYWIIMKKSIVNDENAFIDINLSERNSNNKNK